MDCTLTYGSVEFDDNYKFTSFYNIISVSHETEDEASLPVLYFVPKHLKIPKGIDHKYVRVNKDEIVESLKWLNDNAEHVLHTSNYITVLEDKSDAKTVATVVPL